MGGNKTKDGWRLEQLARTVEGLGAKVREKGRHLYELNYPGSHYNCALATTTSVDHHLVPWLKKATGYEKNTIYQALRTGEW